MSVLLKDISVFKELIVNCLFSVSTFLDRSSFFTDVRSQARQSTLTKGTVNEKTRVHRELKAAQELQSLRVRSRSQGRITAVMLH